MVISNRVGSTKVLSEMCKLLGTTDISKQVEAISEEEFKKLALGDHFIDNFGTCDDSDYICLYITEGVRPEDPWDADKLKREKGRCVATLSIYEDGPHVELPIMYLDSIVKEEIRVIRAEKE